MYKFYRLFIFVILIGTLPLFAQEEEGNMHMTPSPPLEDEFMKWMIGEWEGQSKSEMGESNDHITYEMDFGGQFIVMHYNSERENGTVMTGMGVITHTQDGKYTGYWVDSWRTLSVGKGYREGNLSTMEWSTPMGIYVRKTEKVDENTMRITGLMTNADGTEIRSESNYKRIK